MKKRGFTLIELLAVIVILAVIALIAVPMILNVVEDARISAFKDSVYSAFNAVEYYLIDEDLGDVPESGIEVKFLNLKNNNFESGRMVKNVDGVLVAEFVSDGKYCATGSLTNLNISKGECEINAPGVEANVSGKEVTVTITDDNGIVAYAITTSSEEPTEWINVEETTRIEENITAEAAGTYYVHVRNKYGKTTTKEYVVEQNAFCAYEIGYVWEFSYNGTNGSDGSPEEFTVPCDGTYKLEVWGASGADAITNYSGKANITGGKGGYSYGNKSLLQTEKLYLVVGGSGTGVNGGYNGGGSAYPDWNVSTAGGGATHIATGDTNRGELKNYNNHKEEVLIVAGGGGGGTNANTSVSYAGGSGGGTSGGNGSQASTTTSVGGTGGTQLAAGVSSFTSGGFGYGGYQDGIQDYGIRAGGGGGWYGGGAGTKGGGGGSGYIGGVIGGVTENGVRTGNGYAQITLISID